jgi:hypothetical protein
MLSDRLKSRLAAPSTPTTERTKARPRSPRSGLSFTVLTFLPPSEQFFLDGLAQQSLDVGEGVGKLDFGEGVVDFDIGHEQRALISFQPLNLKVEVSAIALTLAHLGQLQPFP